MVKHQKNEFSVEYGNDVDTKHLNPVSIFWTGVDLFFVPIIQKTRVFVFLVTERSVTELTKE